MDETNTQNDNEMRSETSEKTGGMNWMLIGLALVLLLVGGYYFMTKSNETTMMEDTTSETTTETTETNLNDATDSTMVEDTTGEVVVEEGDVQSVSVEGGMFYYEPDRIVVKQGVPVKVTFTNVEGMHDFVIDDLDVKSTVISAGTSTIVEFTPDEPGEYEFYCSVADHKARGMVGTLVVE